MSDTALHYDELARRLGVTIPTARRMVNRFRWRRTRDNHGRALIHVPDEYLARRAEAMETPSRADMRADLETAPETAGRADQRAARKADLEGAQMAALMARLEALERELMDAVHKLGAAEADTTNTRHMVEELRVLLDETR